MEEKLAAAVERGDWAKVEASLLAHMNKSPTDLPVVAAYATRMFDKGHYGLAIHLYKYLINMWHEADPIQRAGIWSQMGAALRVEGHEEESRYCFEQVIKTGAGLEYAYGGMAIGYIGQAQPEKVIEYANKALAIRPDFDDVRWNRSTAYLETRRWKEGWEDYEYGERGVKRWKTYHPDKQTQQWEGKRNQSVVVWGEQGVGDEIMFGTCLPDIIKRLDRGKVILECHPRLEKTWRRSFPDLTIYPTRKLGKRFWPYHHEIDKQISVASLPKHFRNSDGEFPGTPFLKADPERVKYYRAKLEALGSGPYVCLAWFGGEKKTRQDYRSIPLKAFVPIRVAGGVFVSVQYNKWGHEKEAMEQGLQWWDGYYDKTGPIEDLDEMFALIEASDLVISVCQTAIHMAGAIGKECWCLVPSHPAWRYLIEGDRMPWYNSVRLIRQGMDEPWETVLQRVAGEYREWKEAHKVQEHQNSQAGGPGRVSEMAASASQSVAG